MSQAAANTAAARIATFPLGGSHAFLKDDRPHKKTIIGRLLMGENLRFLTNQTETERG